jgi:hypothetical protein
MNMPRFTGEASLYKTSGHYQSRSRAMSLPGQMVSSIYPAAVSMGTNCANCVGSECVELHCFENWVQSGAPPGGPYQEGMESGPFPNGGPVGPLPKGGPRPRPDCRIECHPILIYDPITKTTREELTCVRKCETPVPV